MLAINDDPVMIKSIEWGIIERGVPRGLGRPKPPLVRTRLVGRRRRVRARRGWPRPRSSTRAGHRVVVYERDEGPGGLIRLGVPDFKLEKWIIDRRVALLEAAGIAFELRRRRRHRPRIDELTRATTRSCWPSARGSSASSRCPAASSPASTPRWTYLCSATAPSSGGVRRGAAAHRARQARDRDRRRRHRGRLRGLRPPRAARSRSRSSTSTRRPRARSTRELAPWPDFPKRLWSTYALDEGGERHSSFNATAFDGGDGHVRALRGDRVGRAARLRADGRDAELPADLVLIAIGFTGPEREAWSTSSASTSTSAAAIASTDFMTSRRRRLRVPATRAAASR